MKTTNDEDTRGKKKEMLTKKEKEKEVKEKLSDENDIQSLLQELLSGTGAHRLQGEWKMEHKTTQHDYLR